MSIFAKYLTTATATYQASAVSNSVDEFNNPTYTPTTNTIELVLAPADTREIGKLALQLRNGTDAKTMMLSCACHNPSTLPSGYGLGDEMTCTYGGKSGTLRIEYVYPNIFPAFTRLSGQLFVASFTHN